MTERLPRDAQSSTLGGDAAPSASPTQTAAPTEVRSAPRPTHWLDNMALAHVSIPQVLEASGPIPGRLVQDRRLWLAAACSETVGKFPTHAHLWLLTVNVNINALTVNVAAY